MQMLETFEVARKINSKWSLVAFAISALLAIVGFLLRKRGKKTGFALTAVFVIALLIAILGLAPIVAPYYIMSRSIYRVRAIVLDVQKLPVDDANVTSSMGGEPKRVAGGWEFDIPAAAKPDDGKLTIYASLPSAFLTGRVEVRLAADFNPLATVQLARDTSARVRGVVVARSGHPVSGAKIGVVGYASEAVITPANGDFNLVAHAAEGQQTELVVQKAGFLPTRKWCQAGEDHAQTIILDQ
jgi:hypothetical protein